MSRRGRAILPPPNASLQATLAASDSIGDHATCLSPVRAVSPLMAAESEGLSIGPVSRTALEPTSFSLDITMPLAVAQSHATGAPFPRRTDSGPAARSGS